MNTVQKFLSVLSDAISSGSRTSSQSLAVVPLTVKRKLGPNERIVYLEESDPIDVDLCRISLGKMFRKSWFDICVVRECADLLRVSMFETSKSMDRLHALHCVHWDQMSPAIREMIPELISEIFTEGAYPGNVGSVVSEQ